MRRGLMILILVGASCAPAAPPAAEAQQQASIASCVSAATTHDALMQCQGVVATPCMDEPGGDSTMGMIDCWSREGEQWQTLLDAHIAALNADDPSRTEFLTNAQTAWTAWREAECRYQASEAEGGSLSGVISALCAGKVTADRVIALTWAQRSTEE